MAESAETLLVRLEDLQGIDEDDEPYIQDILNARAIGRELLRRLKCGELVEVRP